MHASPTLRLRLLLSPLVMAAVLAAPCAFAKKDLFANEPGSKQALPAEQLAPANSAATEESTSSAKAQIEATKPDDAIANTLANTEAKREALDAQKARSIVKDSPAGKDVDDENITSKESATKEPSAIEVQLERFKRSLTKTKNDLFGSKESSEKKSAASSVEPQTGETAPAEEGQKPEINIISTTEAAQRAQTFAEGQVINVRLYQASGDDEGKPRYAVKLLQKNGRMKTINLDAVNGALIEEKPAEENPQ